MNKYKKDFLQWNIAIMIECGWMHAILVGCMLRVDKESAFLNILCIKCISEFLVQNVVQHRYLEPDATVRITGIRLSLDIKTKARIKNILWVERLCILKTAS